ncbi:MAG: imelysin family protein [Bradymonadia bacterium]
MQHRSKFSALSVLLCSALGLTSCLSSADDDGSASGDKAVVAHIAEAVGIPVHAALSTEVTALRQALDSVCAAPSAAGASQAREAWRTAQRAWFHADAFGIGPVTMNRLGSSIAWPPDHEAIAETLAEVESSTEAIDQGFVANLGSSRKGLGAIEMLLFEPADDAELVTALVGRRCDLLVALVADVDRAAVALSEAWRGDYGPAMAAANGDPFPRQQAVIDALVNRHVEITESLLVTQIGTPLGEKTGGVPQPDKVLSTRSEFARAEIAATIEGIAAIYAGVGEGPGLIDSIQRRQSGLAADLTAGLTEAISAVNAIEQPLHIAVAESPEQVRTALEAVRVVKRLLAADVANVLGVTRTFSENDGD